MQVEIYLNTDARNSMYYGYQPHDTLALAASYEVACPGEDAKPAGDRMLVEDAFERFNIGEDAIAKEYRAKRHRSLSKGDIVVIQDGDDRRAYAVAGIGWDKVDAGFKVGPYLCQNVRCFQEFGSDADRFDHYDNTGHVIVY